MRGPSSASPATTAAAMSALVLARLRRRFTRLERARRPPPGPQLQQRVPRGTADESARRACRVRRLANSRKQPIDALLDSDMTDNLGDTARFDQHTLGVRKVELRGFEPLTPTLPVWCATNCAIAPKVVLVDGTPPAVPVQSRWSRQFAARLRAQRTDRSRCRIGRPARLWREPPADGGDQQDQAAHDESPAEREVLSDLAYHE
jgi:hypothetical protein